MFYFISKLFNAFLLPPGVFIIFFIIIAVKADKKTIKYLSISCAVFLYLISTKPISDLLIKPLETIVNQKNDAKFTILLGGGVSPYDFFKFSPHAFKREIYSYLISKNNTLIFTGSDNEISAFIKDYETFSKVFGIQIRRFFTQPAYNTYQNAKKCSRLFEKKGWNKKIYLVTSAYHMKRSAEIFKHFGFEVIPKPVDFMYDGSYAFTDFLPNARSLYISYITLHEYFGILSLKLRGL